MQRVCEDCEFLFSYEMGLRETHDTLTRESSNHNISKLEQAITDCIDAQRLCSKCHPDYSVQTFWNTTGFGLTQ